MKDEVITKVNTTRELIKTSVLHDDSKELLYSLLEHAAESANGTPDKLKAIGDTLLAFCLYEIRSTVRFPAQLNQAAADAVKAHTESCPMRNFSMNMPKVATWIYPFRWPLCVVTCVIFLAPNALAILHTALKFWTAS